MQGYLLVVDAMKALADGKAAPNAFGLGRGIET